MSNPARFRTLPWHVDQWLNASDAPALHGRVVVVEVFQMLCPGCVSHALPQARRLQALFPEQELAVIGLHSVFEHHAVMTPDALAAFVHENRLTFPIAIDAPADTGPIPRTMHAWGLQGTPSLVLLDRQGRTRLRHFGLVDDLQLGAWVGRLLADTTQPPPEQGQEQEQEQQVQQVQRDAGHGCSGDVCS
jgi:hypothetical protein